MVKTGSSSLKGTSVGKPKLKKGNAVQPRESLIHQQKYLVLTTYFEVLGNLNLIRTQANEKKLTSPLFYPQLH